jgi:hypothetical protein
MALSLWHRRVLFNRIAEAPKRREDELLLIVLNVGLPSAAWLKGASCILLMKQAHGRGKSSLIE